jgi:hypothetical protein
VSEDADKLGGHLGLWLCERMWNEYGALRLGAEKYRVASAEDYEAWGYDSHDVTGPTLLVREPDGQVFEIEVDVHARRVAPSTRDGAS